MFIIYVQNSATTIITVQYTFIYDYYVNMIPIYMVFVYCSSLHTTLINSSINIKFMLKRQKVRVTPSQVRVATLYTYIRIF